MDYISRLNTLLKKYSQGNCSVQEKNEMIALLLRAEDDKMDVAEATEIWERLKTESPNHMVDWDQMYANVRRADHQVSAFGYGGKKSRLRFQLTAAVMALLAVGAVYLYFFRQNTAAVPVPVAATVKKAELKPELKYQSIHLPDGSLVILFPGSRLNRPPAFNGKTREVTLVGEAYFDIAHNPRQPFIVHTGKLSTRVLGTAFDIKAYPGEASIEVTVKRGKVQVLNNNKPIGLLTANQMISFSKSDEKYERRAAPPLAVEPAGEGELLLDNITMKEAAERIESLFHLQVEFTNSGLEQCRITATFSRNDSLEEILTVICGVVKARFHVANNLAIIEGEACHN